MITFHKTSSCSISTSARRFWLTETTSECSIWECLFLIQGGEIQEISFSFHETYIYIYIHASFKSVGKKDLKVVSQGKRSKSGTTKKDGVEAYLFPL